MRKLKEQKSVAMGKLRLSRVWCRASGKRIMEWVFDGGGHHVMCVKEQR